MLNVTTGCFDSWLSACLLNRPPPNGGLCGQGHTARARRRAHLFADLHPFRYSKTYSNYSCYFRLVVGNNCQSNGFGNFGIEIGASNRLNWISSIGRTGGATGRRNPRNRGRDWSPKGACAFPRAILLSRSSGPSPVVWCWGTPAPALGPRQPGPGSNHQYVTLSGEP